MTTPIILATAIIGQLGFLRTERVLCVRVLVGRRR